MSALPLSPSDDLSSSALPMSTLARHPLDPDVRVGHVSVDYAIDIVKARRAKAVIIPYKDKARLRKYVQSLTDNVWDGLQEKTVVHHRHSKLHAPNIDRIPAWIQNEIRDIFNDLNDIQHARGKDIVLLADRPSAGHKGFAPFMHRHKSIDLHQTIYGATLEWTRINVTLSGMSESQIIRYPYLEETIIRADVGDTIIFGPDFWHRSSARIPQEGRISLMKPELRYM
ncbi:MAG TPA: hypothetical protein DHW10_00250 [Rhodospirillaceae bacterium]|nr:hypothetical protein [Rhodospirillaceae bacterium]